MSGGDEHGFLSRWARRKEAAQRGEVPESDAAALEPAAPPQEVAPDPRGESEILQALGLPDPDTLTAGADYKAYLAAAVPVAIRNRALRALWRSDPRLANLDGLVDHGEDFSDKSTVRAGMKTAYQVGRGILRQISDGDAATPQVEAVAGADNAEARALEARATVPERSDREAVTAVEAPAPSEESGAPRRVRRMQFSAAGPATLVEEGSGRRE